MFILLLADFWYQEGLLNIERVSFHNSLSQAISLFNGFNAVLMLCIVDQIV